ncbi:MAG: sugar ABC transporter ATP-binding protein, partial [Actinobacteria bacterium]|nr:sugar ABC transporter ATP-binding protein [Actinomycetota bacterium]
MSEKNESKNNSNGTVLNLINVFKEFPGVKALQGVDFELRRGEVHGLVGENGAGKSTLMKILMGVYAKDSGSIIIEGKQADIRTPEDAHEHGIGMIFQELSLIPQLNVAQNIFLSIEPRKRLPFFSNDRDIYSKTKELLNKYKIDLNPKELIENLSRGYSQIVEVLKVLAQKSKIIIMDEPTASLTKTEEETLYEIINNLKSHGVSIIYISHRLQEIFNTCDRITVLRDGKRVDTKEVSDIDMDILVTMMTGKTCELVHHHAMADFEGSGKQHILEVKNLHIKPRVNGIDFKLKPGEILGITGLMGSGKSETARALFGIERFTQGEILIDGNKVKIKNSSDSVNAGIYLVPEDRRREGLVLNQTVESNLTLPILSNISKAGFVSDRQSIKRSLEQISRLSIKTPSASQETVFLSGGNQQKIVIGKWLMETPKVLILDEPTVGVDVNTKAELRNIISDLVSSRLCSVILFSSELNEVIQLADRILVLY